MPLTPKQKAEELLNKFRKFADGIDSSDDRFSPRIEKENGKKIALEVVDEILKEIGNLLINMIRSSDTACRYGGEEMLLILPESSLESTVEKAEEIRSAITHLQLHHKEHSQIALTASFGVACFPDQGITVDEVIKAADVALFQAKEAGRNQVIVASI